MKRMPERRFDLIGAFFWTLTGLPPVVERVNSLMEELGRMRLVVIVPSKVTGRVYTDAERWVFPDELRDLLSRYVDPNRISGIRDHVLGFVASVAAYAGLDGLRGSCSRMP